MSYKTINVNNYPKLQLSQIGKKIDSNLFSMGRNDRGQLGVGDNIERSSPTLVTVPFLWSKINPAAIHTIGIQSNGTLWTWGYNVYGELGLGDSSIVRSAPVKVGNLSVWTKITAANFVSVAIQSNGTLWSWGLNNGGQLGLSDLTDRSSPVQVGTQSNWTQIAGAGGSHILALQSNGTLWTWGNNQVGQLGQGDTTNRSTPTQIGALSVWTQIAVGANHSLAIQSNGTLWGWGDNFNGQLGLNTSSSYRSSPVQVGSLSTWTKINCSNTGALALQSNGTLWSWGSNGTGQLGLSDITDRSSPTQVGTESYWTQINSGGSFHFAYQSNGTLWTWGNNAAGQLGLNDVTNRSSPIQITTFTPIIFGTGSGAAATFFTKTIYF